MVRKRAHNPDPIAISSNSCAVSTGQIPVSALDDYDVMTSSTMSIISEAESDLDTSGGSGRNITTGVPNTQTSNNAASTSSFRSSPPPNYKQNCAKNNRRSEAWYSHILTIEDLIEVDAARGKFIFNLQELVTKKQAILSSHELSTEVYYLFM